MNDYDHYNAKKHKLVSTVTKKNEGRLKYDWKGPYHFNQNSEEKLQI